MAACPRRQTLGWLLLGLLAGCGKRGDLELPPETPVQQVEPAQQEPAREEEE